MWTCLIISTWGKKCPFEFSACVESDKIGFGQLPLSIFLVGRVSSWQSNGETMSLCGAAGTCAAQSLPGAGTVGGTAWWFPQQRTWDGEVGVNRLWGKQGCSLVLSSSIGAERVIETSKIFPWLCWSILVGSLEAGSVCTAGHLVPNCSPPEVSDPFRGCNQLNESCKGSLTYTWALRSN